jgi:hypothetical protein
LLPGVRVPEFLFLVVKFFKFFVDGEFSVDEELLDELIKALDALVS